MKAIKALAMLFIAATLTFSAGAQGTTSKSTTTATKSSTPEAKPTTKDPVDPKLKGPKGETVYTGAKGGKYYFNASGNKTYLKQK